MKIALSRCEIGIKSLRKVGTSPEATSVRDEAIN